MPKCDFNRLVKQYRVPQVILKETRLFRLSMPSPIHGI